MSWRKPIEFGMSGGITTLSLAAVMSRLPRTGWLAWSCAVAISLFIPETLLIGAMGTLIGFVSLAIIVMTIRSFTSLRGPASSVLAIRAGMVFLTIGQLLGFAILATDSPLTMASGRASSASPGS